MHLSYITRVEHILFTSQSSREFSLLRKKYCNRLSRGCDYNRLLNVSDTYIISTHIFATYSLQSKRDANSEQVLHHAISSSVLFISSKKKSGTCIQISIEICINVSGVKKKRTLFNTHPRELPGVTTLRKNI